MIEQVAVTEENKEKIRSQSSLLLKEEAIEMITCDGFIFTDFTNLTPEYSFLIYRSSCNISLKECFC